MKRKKLAAFGLVIALTASSSSAAFAAAVPAAPNMETTAVQQMDQAEETDTDILSDSEAVELQQEIASYSNDGILLTAAAPSTIGGVATTDIINAAKVMIRKYEGSYSSVNANDNGALSIGKMQWHADRAKSLLRIIISGDAASAQAILGDALYNEILSDGSWSKRVLTADEAKKDADIACHHTEPAGTGCAGKYRCDRVRQRHLQSRYPQCGSRCLSGRC